jgi:hypothetical protein
MQISYAWKPGGIKKKSCFRQTYMTPGMKRRPEKNYAWNSILRLEFYIHVHYDYADSAS